MLLGSSGEAADMGPSGVPEEDHASFDQHIGHRDQVPFPAVAGIEGILDLLSFVRGLVQHEFLGEVSSVGLFCHENLPFSRPYRDSQYTLTFPRWARLFVSCFLFTRLPRARVLGNSLSVLRNFIQ